MAVFQNNFWGEKNGGFDVLYHNMKHGQLATKELAEFVRESAAIEETYSKSMSKLAKLASNGSPQGTFAPLWDVFRVSSDKLALCHLELMRKMNDLIRDINKYADEQVKVHRKTKEEMVGTVEAVQALSVQSGHLQKAKEGYQAKCLELERLRKEGAPTKELEKAEQKSKKAAESFALSVDKFNRVGGDFQTKMSDSAQKFQGIEEAHLRQMKALIKGYSHSVEDTHVQVGQVHEEFKQNVENIGIINLIQKIAEQKGTGKERPALVGFEEYLSSVAAEGKKSRAKAFRIPGLGKREREPGAGDSAVTEALNSPLEVDDEGFVIRADSTQNGCSEDKENHFYSSDSDFDDDEPKKFHIQIRPVAPSNRPSTGATERELKATVGALTLPPKVSMKRNLSRASSTAGGDGDGTSPRDGEQEGFRRSTSSPDHSRLSSTVSGSDSLFGPPLESAFKSKSFDSQLREHSAFSASEYAAFSSDSSSPENVEDSGLDSPSHQAFNPSPEPPAPGWAAAWPPLSHTTDPHSRHSHTLGRPATDPFLSSSSSSSANVAAFSRSFTVEKEEALSSVWSSNNTSKSRPSRKPSQTEPPSGQSVGQYPLFNQSLFPPSELESSVWNCKHIPSEDPFLAAFHKTCAAQETPNMADAWTRPPPRQSTVATETGGRGADPFTSGLADAKKTLQTLSSSSSSTSSSHRKDRDRKRDRSLPPPVTSDDPFAITMIGSPTHQSTLAASTGLTHTHSNHNINTGNTVNNCSASVGSTNNRLGIDVNSSSLPHPQPKKELIHWSSLHNPFSEKSQEQGLKSEVPERRKHRSSEGEPRRNAPVLTRHSGPQEDLCFSTDRDQDCLDLNTQQAPCPVSSHKGSKQPSRQTDPAEPHRTHRVKRTPGRLTGAERSRSLCSSPLPEPSPPLSSSSSCSPSEEWGGQSVDWGGGNQGKRGAPADWAGHQGQRAAAADWGAQSSEWGGGNQGGRAAEWGGQTQNRAVSPAGRATQSSPLPYQHQEQLQRPVHLSRGPSPVSLSTQEAWPVAAAITEYINAYFKGGQHNRCLVKITGDLTMSFPAGMSGILGAHPNPPVLSFRLLNMSRVDHFLPNSKLLYSDPSQSDPDSTVFWFNMPALQLLLHREAELNPQASYHNVGLLKYQVSSQDPGRAPLLLSAECQRSGTVTRVSLDYHCCPATAPHTQLTSVQVCLPTDHSATDLQCQPPAAWNAEERRLLWKLSSLCPTNHSKGSGTLCASWQSPAPPRAAPAPSLAVQFVGSGASLCGLDLELLPGRYRMSLLKKRFATGKYMAGCSL